MNSFALDECLLKVFQYMTLYMGMAKGMQVVIYLSIYTATRPRGHFRQVCAVELG